MNHWVMMDIPSVGTITYMNDIVHEPLSDDGYSISWQ